MATLSTLDPRLIVRPRIKKSTLPTQQQHRSKARKRTAEHAIEAIDFDHEQRADYLTGFHRRKLQRIGRAKAEAEKKEREERIRIRKQLREERKQELEEHVKSVNQLLNRAGSDDEPDFSNSASWDGLEPSDAGPAPQAALDHQEEYIDEDKYTTVTIETVNVDKEGLHTTNDDDGEDDDGNPPVQDDARAPSRTQSQPTQTKKSWPAKTKKKKFRYESKAERKANRVKDKAKRRSKAEARRSND